MTLMFDKNQVEEATYLARLLRLIFYKRKITHDDFSALWAEHGQRLGQSTDVTNTNRNNARRTMSHPDHMTFRFFHYTLLNILRLDIEEFRVVIRDPTTGERVTISSHDPVE
jgi:hypothetical protein